MNEKGYLNVIQLKFLKSSENAISAITQFIWPESYTLNYTFSVFSVKLSPLVIICLNLPCVFNPNVGLNKYCFKSKFLV